MERILCVGFVTQCYNYKQTVGSRLCVCREYGAIEDECCAEVKYQPEKCYSRYMKRIRNSGEIVARSRKAVGEKVVNTEEKFLSL